MTTELVHLAAPCFGTKTCSVYSGIHQFFPPLTSLRVCLPAICYPFKCVFCPLIYTFFDSELMIVPSLADSTSVPCQTGMYTFFPLLHVTDRMYIVIRPPYMYTDSFGKFLIHLNPLVHEGLRVESSLHPVSRR
jgi:hypothetical protein